MWWLPALIIISSALFSGKIGHVAVAAPTQTPTEIAIQPTPTLKVEATVAKSSEKEPKMLRIPAINLETPIVAVGMNEKQLVDVPERLPGWYKGGAKPGEAGNATLQGHVTAVFNKLNQIKAGDDIYVDDKHFRVTETELTRKEDFNVQKVYGPTDKKKLNLITCAGTIVNGDFDKRTIVYSELATP